jgi:hypothetical protein
MNLFSVAEIKCCDEVVVAFSLISFDHPTNEVCGTLV